MAAPVRLMTEARYGRVRMLRRFNFAEFRCCRTISKTGAAVRRTARSPVCQSGRFGNCDRSRESSRHGR